MLDLFVYWRAVAPQDTAWESAPLVLHDERLITVRVGWPPHEPEQPWDLVEAMTRILGHHPGPSIFVPPPFVALARRGHAGLLDGFALREGSRRVDYLQLVPGRIDRAAAVATSHIVPPVGVVMDHGPNTCFIN
jgi:hypothetical protein